MDHSELLDYFIAHYHTRKEVSYRLPIGVPIASFWPDMLAHRQARATVLPLRAASGGRYWFVPTPRLTAAGDELARLLRRQDAQAAPADPHEGGLEDEAYYSSAIEGAFSTRNDARALIRSGKAPQTRDERMIVNNYEALRFVLSHLDGPISEALILEISRILTDGTMEEGAAGGWRDSGVSVISGRQEIVYVAPDADRIRPMLDDLIAFVNDDNVHPVIRACAAHIYFVTIHPLYDGNGRTARALAYMILLKAGYDFFRAMPISGLLYQERARYYKAIRASQDPENGLDLTYFIEYYADMLARSLADLRLQADRAARVDELKKASAHLASSQRLCDGYTWLSQRDEKTITASQWQEKLGVSFETARADLMWLAKNGFLHERTVGHRKYFGWPA